MILDPRPECSNSRERYQQKALIVAKHLAEYRMSSKEHLSSLLGQKVTSTARFFQQLEKEKIIVPFTNFHTSKSDLVRLGPLGATMIDGPGHETTRHLLRSDRLEKNERVTHDLLVQTACIDAFNSFKNIVEMVSSYNIQSSSNVADSYLFNDDLAAIAIEMEASQKSRDRIYFTMTNYVKMIYFIRETDQKYYANLFNELSWPIYKTAKRGKFLDLRSDGTLQVPADSWIRSRFKFRLLKSAKPSIMNFDPNRVCKTPDMGYMDRLIKIAEDAIIEKEKREREEEERRATARAAEAKRREEEAAQRAEAHKIWEANQRVAAAAREAEERRKNSLMGRLFG
jgi:hypothetical protein